MANLTITIDDEMLKRARIRALQQGTSVNALLRDYLATYVGDDPLRSALSELLAIAKASKSGSGKKGRSWKREDAHER